MEKSQFTDLIKQGFNHIPFSKEIVVDTDTALALYLKLANTPYSYFLESVQGGEKWGRYSFIGLAAETIIKVYDYEVRVEVNGALVEQYEVENPLEWIENYQNQFNVPKLDDLPDFNGGLVGYFGYEIIRYIEPRLANINKTDELNIADILLMVSNDLLVVDNLSSKVHIITHINPDESTYEDALSKLNVIEDNIKKSFHYLSNPSPEIKTDDFVSSFGKNNFMKTVEDIQRYIIAGDVMQVGTFSAFKLSIQG
jgi:anthranilate synthase component 1